MKAADLLRATGHDIDRVRAEMHPVDLDRVRFLPIPGFILRFWPDNVGAITLGTRVYMRPSRLFGDPQGIRLLVVHELVHVRQWAEYGGFGFLRRYLGEYFRGRMRGLGHNQAYERNRLEVEATQLADGYRII